MATMRVCVYFSNDNMETFDLHGTLQSCNDRITEHIDLELKWQFSGTNEKEVIVTKVTTDWRPS